MKSSFAGSISLGVVISLALGRLPAAPTRAAERKESKVIEIKLRDIVPQQAARVSYARQIKPILINNCLECHNSDDREGGFETTSVANVLKKGKKGGPGVVPGKPDESEIVVR